nr:hypothetical protein [uncultured Aminipila sp.]
MNNFSLEAVPFDSEMVTNPKTGQEEYDRVAHSKDLADLIRAYFSNGILVRGSDLLTNELQVLHLSAMSCVVKPGGIIINGRTGFLETEQTLEFDVGTQNPRIDRVVAELNIAERNIFIKVLKGIAEADPKPIAIMQTEDIYQIPLAKVRINANQSVIASVTDDRGGCISNVLLNQAPSKDITATTVGISEGLRNLLGLSVDNANAEKAIEKMRKDNPPKIEVIKYFTTSQNWTVPSGVTRADIYIVGGGYNGNNGGNAYGSASHSHTSGGTGGDGGKINYIPNYKLTCGTVISIVVGAIGGGDSSFGEISTLQSSLKFLTSSGNITNFPTTNGTVGFICPIDGGVYGACGANGGNASVNKNETVSVDSGSNMFSKSGGNSLSQYGSLPSNSDSWVGGGGGGASFNSNGGSAYSPDGSVNKIHGGNGGNALPNTGNGGGGGGAVANYFDVSGGVGTGGIGGAGVVIIKYYL